VEYFAAILHFSFSSEEIIVRKRADRISVNENTTEIANSCDGTKLPRIENNANKSGA
jgi:hypothetical protein